MTTQRALGLKRGLGMTEQHEHPIRSHPDSPNSALSGIGVTVTWDATGRLHLDYLLSGDVDRVHQPENASPARVDGLWQTTCFEAFLGLPDSDIYYEFNFSPGGLWAVYRFSAPREEMSAPPFSPGPVIRRIRGQGRMMISAHIDIRKFPELELARSLDCGLSAVIEEETGEKSYWALDHGNGPPDFHNRDCFRVKLASPHSA